MEYVLIVVAIAFLTAGQLLQKLSAVRAETRLGRPPNLRQMLLQRETWWAAFCLGCGALTWLLVLYHMPVSKAFPMLSLGTIFVVLAARFHLREEVSFARWLGVLVVVVGVVLLART